MDDYGRIVFAEKTINKIWPFVLEKQNANYRLEQCKDQAKLYKSNYMPGVWMTKVSVPLAIVCALIFFLWPQQRDIFGGYNRAGIAIVAAMIGFLAAIGILVGVILRLTYGKGYRNAKNNVQQLEQLVKEAEENLQNIKLLA